MSEDERESEKKHKHHKHKHHHKNCSRERKKKLKLKQKVKIESADLTNEIEVKETIADGTTKQVLKVFEHAQEKVILKYQHPDIGISSNSISCCFCFPLRFTIIFLLLVEITYIIYMFQWVQTFRENVAARKNYID